VLVASPFAVLAGVVYLVFLTGGDINYYLADRPPAFYAAAALVGLLALIAGVLGAWLYVRWSLALPILLFEGCSATTALRTSSTRVRGAGWPIAGTLFGWHLLGAAAGAAALAAFGLLAAGLYRTAGGRLGVVLPLTAALLALYALLTAAGSYVNAAGHGLLVLRWYAARGGRAELCGPDALAAPVPPASRAWLFRLAGLGGAAFAGAVLFLCISLARPLGIEEPIEVIAHRGSSRDAPENTLSAFRKAIEVGADYAELDVQRTADGAVVVLHDEDLLRVAKVNRKLADMTLAEIQAVDVGRRFGPEFAGERIPTLAETIALARDRIKLVIELKFYGKDRGLAAQVAQMVHDEEFEEQCVVSSLNYDGLLAAKRANPRLKTAAIISAAVGDVSRMDVDVLMVHAPLLTDRLLRAARRRGKGVMVWTVDDPREAGRLVERGVHRILTNDPAALVRVRDERAALTDGERLLLAARHLIRVGN
jgi:glycerophosphoryl diester phosphodiesterase